jgi:hypothetical protein
VASRCARCTRKASFPHRSSTRRQPPNHSFPFIVIFSVPSSS